MKRVHRVAGVIALVAAAAACTADTVGPGTLAGPLSLSTAAVTVSGTSEIESHLTPSKCASPSGEVSSSSTYIVAYDTSSACRTPAPSSALPDSESTGSF